MITACLRTASPLDRSALAIAGAPVSGLDRLIADGRMVVGERHGRLIGFAAVDPVLGMSFRVLEPGEVELARWLRWYAETAAYLAPPVLVDAGASLAA